MSLLGNFHHLIGVGRNRWELSREYRMIHGGPGFLSVVWFGFLTRSPFHPPLELTDGRGRPRRPQESMVLYKSSTILWIIADGIGNIHIDLFRHVITEYMGQVCAMETQPAGHQLLNS
jgi:hypothetical protein